MEGLTKALIALGLIGGGAYGVNKYGIEGMKEKAKGAVKGSLPLLPTMYIGSQVHGMREDLGGIKGEMGRTNELLEDFLMRNGGTPKGVIEFGNSVTGNPVAETGEIITRPRIT